MGSEGPEAARDALADNLGRAVELGGDLVVVAIVDDTRQDGPALLVGQRGQ
nr:hypothetical protein [Solirubrobacter soli]